MEISIALAESIARTAMGWDNAKSNIVWCVECTVNGIPDEFPPSEFWKSSNHADYCAMRPLLLLIEKERQK